MRTEYKEKPDFDSVFNTYKQKVFELTYKFFNNHTDAEDITQEVFLRAYKSYDKFRIESEIYSWLYRIAVNLCNEKIRKKIQLRKHLGEIGSIDQSYTDKNGEEKVVDIHDKTSLPPLEQLQKDEMRARVQEAIESMPEKYRQVIILKEINDMSYEEVIRITGLTSSAVGVRILRARQILKEKLKNIM